jgi:tRNA(His) 5'-end guanylyltransferase
MTALWPNHARACVKTLVSKFGNDQILAVSDFDEMSRRIEWSEIEFSHRLALQRTPRCAFGLFDNVWPAQWLVGAESLSLGR